MEKVKVAAVQFDVKSGDKARNLAKALELLQRAGKEGVNVVAIPMDFLTGIPITKEVVMKIAEPIPGPTTNKLAKIAEKYKMYILGGTIIEKADQKFYETCPLLGPDGTLVGKYRKVHTAMVPPTDEIGAGITAGTEYPIFKIDIGAHTRATIGVLLGTDIDFPEPARILALKGAEIIFWITAVDYSWIHICRCLTESYAFVNSVYMVFVNATGISKEWNQKFFGESRIINQTGETISSAGESHGTLSLEGMAIATLDLGLLHRIRKQASNLLKRRKPETYYLITESITRDSPR